VYSKDDLIAVKGQITKFLLLLLGIFAIFLTAAILAKKSSENLGMIIIVIGVCIDIFIWGMFTAPMVAYYRYLRDVTTGRSRVITGVVKKVGKEPVYKDNKLFYYEVLIEEDGIERILLLDNQKQWPEISAGQTYDFVIHENYVLTFKETAA